MFLQECGSARVGVGVSGKLFLMKRNHKMDIYCFAHIKWRFFERGNCTCLLRTKNAYSFTLITCFVIVSVRLPLRL